MDKNSSKPIFCFQKLKLDFRKKPPITQYQAVQASHQGNCKYGESAVMQCTSNAYISIVFSVVKNINLWKSLDLDYILE